ncbi:nucleotidyl transferase AbiEii/AbiGii toxin family protein [Flavobacterium muglaense]|uniref:Nucleotidyl transferase AbiEii/AbiGii toxin family protein n=1 Tax=Flavobacterium muglaense TaxID=2764716 RepID=A0A923N2V9_9FLAO|nr:nucleotidyl transferase AbiEii/AbiGii toxin family protein [Flavobacterium muglaense]MBC5839719.1 nucleotidyl transferase AbiEii/AbiGii toxin family protein [Flavobacterium muglaense]MBC5846247.1 nucleotidyl transferase AbiEii/AbiGii toxin family protein [Flavobacterium muglaense]
MNKFTHLQEWFQLPDETKIRLFTETSRQIGLPSSSAAEKDWWVVHTLSVIFSMDCANALIFKGGTSLSKGWNVIHRFSEDIDLALDREFLGFSGELTKGDIRKLRRKSFQFISEVFTEELKNKFTELGFENVTVKPREVENHDQDPLIIEIYYNKLTETDTYLKPGVLVEVGSRSLKEPFTQRTFGTFISEIYTDNTFTDKPITIPIVNPERTFLEKIFLLHEEFQKPFGKIRVERLSRHLYDIEKLCQTEYAEIALQDRELYNTIVRHRSKFTAISGIDYAKHNPENIKFIPPDSIIKMWKADYEEMKGSMIYGNPLDFDQLINRLTELQKRINAI